MVVAKVPNTNNEISIQYYIMTGGSPLRRTLSGVAVPGAEALIAPSILDEPSSPAEAPDAMIIAHYCSYVRLCRRATRSVLPDVLLCLPSCNVFVYLPVYGRV